MINSQVTELYRNLITYGDAEVIFLDAGEMRKGKIRPKHSKDLGKNIITITVNYPDKVFYREYKTIKAAVDELTALPEFKVLNICEEVA